MKLKEAARVDALDTLQEEVTHVNEDAFKRIHDEKQKKLEEIKKKLKELKEERTKLFEKYANEEDTMSQCGGAGGTHTLRNLSHVTKRRGSNSINHALGIEQY